MLSVKSEDDLFVLVLNVKISGYRDLNPKTLCNENKESDLCML